MKLFSVFLNYLQMYVKFKYVKLQFAKSPPDGANGQLWHHCSLCKKKKKKLKKKSNDQKKK